jgi:uncharacterized membrane-anchored protein
MLSNVSKGLVIAVVAQVAVLTGMVVKAAMPLWTGQEIEVRTVPVDPRSLFRGNYARLGYHFDTVSKADLSGPMRAGEVVYVTLQRGDDGLYTYASASTVEPEAGVYLRGRITRNYGNYRVRYGIEALFAPKDKALDLERRLRRRGAIAVLMVGAGGRAALKEVRSLVPE